VKQTPRALDAYITKSSLELFTKLGIFTDVELHARHEIRLEQYIKKIDIEARLLDEMVAQQVIPAAIRYQKMVVENIEGLKDIGIKTGFDGQMTIIHELSSDINALMGHLKTLREELHKGESTGSPRAHAVYYGDTVVPLMAEIRACSDRLENIIADELWPLPKYREMLFAK
jgi:glutamine synthetase